MMLDVGKVMAGCQENAGIKPRRRPAFDKVVVGHESKGPECRSVICTFIFDISSAAIDDAWLRRHVAAPDTDDASSNQTAAHWFAFG